jgi:hypothetical protein
MQTRQHKQYRSFFSVAALMFAMLVMPTVLTAADATNAERPGLATLVLKVENMT